MRKKLLLADDSITIQKVVELTFPSEEFEVVTAGNGRLAVDKAMSFLPDMVLCDVIMPQLDGYQVCEALRASAELSDVPILLLNGAFEPYDAARAKAVGALGNVSKPFDPPALVARVKEILAARAAASIPRPTQPMSLSAMAELSQANENAGPVAVPHEYAYDESETHPVSTIEVPMDVRELAARSLSLDAPVFAPPQPDVLVPDPLLPEPLMPEPLMPEPLMHEEPSDFSETLHGPLDGELAPEAADIEAPIEASELESLNVETVGTNTIPVEDLASIEEIEAIASTSELESFPTPSAPPAEPESVATQTPVPRGFRAPEEPAASEPMEFEADPEGEPGAVQESPEELPSTLPSMPALILPPPVVEEFSGEHEFEPEAMDEATAEQPVAVIAPQGPEPESMVALPMPEPMAEMKIAPVGLIADAPIGLPSAPVVTVEPPSTLAESAEAGAFDGLVGFADAVPAAVVAAIVPSRPEPSAEAQATTSPASVAAPLPSAEVAVPVDMVQQIAQRVISQVSERVIREIAWDVIPGLAEKLIKAEIERIKARAESERD